MALSPQRSEGARIARRRRRHRSRRDEILRAARRLLEEGGVARFTVSAVADAADVSAPALYYYFDSKEAIVDELWVGLLEEEIALLTDTIERADTAADALSGLVRAKIDHYRTRPKAFWLLYRLLAESGVRSETVDSQLYPRVDALNSRLEERLRAEQESGALSRDFDARRIANVAFCTAQGILGSFLGMNRIGGRMRFGLDELCDEACSMLERAVRPGSSG